MRLGLNRVVGTGALALTTSLIWAGTAAAQCNNTCPGGAQQQNDGCADQVTDPNGGCNFDPAAIQPLGAVSVGSPIVVCGTVGTWGTAQRDLDWYSITLAVPGKVRVTAQHKDALGNPAPNFTTFIINGIDCDTQVTEFATASAACPFVSADIALPAGTHVIIQTVNSFAPDAPACPVTYSTTIEVVENLPPECGGEGNCAEPHGGLGCSDLTCCADVCALSSSCCTSMWDVFCAEVAIDLCGLFVYECVNPGPANDCATSPTDADFDFAYAFNNTNANTDGPPTDACDYGKDLWYLVQAEDNGELQIDVTSDFDSTIGIYAIGPNPAFDPENLPNLFIGCVDILGAGGEAAVLIDAAATEYYLVQVAGFQSTFGAGEVIFSFRRLVYSTGNTNAVKFDATNMGNYTVTNLGWSSGNLNAANPKRWAAQAFNVPSLAPGLTWTITAIHAYGFSAAGATNTTLDYIIYKRTGVTVPTAADQIQSGSVPFPPPFDLVGGGANEDHEILTNFELLPGDYWLTVFPTNATEPVPPSNFAWFTNAPDGINNLDPITNAPRMWRSANFPPGYVVYTLPMTQLMQNTGLDPNDVYNTGFRLLGVKTEVPVSPCPADINGDGLVDGADLGLLTAAWGTNDQPADINDDGIVDGADLGLLVAAWGPCPT